MIVTVTLNLALDVTYHVDRLVPHGSHRVRRQHARAGGKGVNVARVAHARGERVLVTGLLGGPTGELIAAELNSAGIPTSLVPIGEDNRRTVNVVSDIDGDATIFNEPGPPVTDSEWRIFVENYRRIIANASIVALSGSLPRNVPNDAYAQLVSLARNAGCRSVLDTSGASLADAVRAAPDVVKPNAAELAEVTETDDVVVGAQRLRALGAGAVVVSRGPDGLLAVTEDSCWLASAGERIAGNPTGAGDACVAALAIGLPHPVNWPEILAEAVALSGAAVAADAAGDFVESVYHRLQTRVEVRKFDAAHFDE